jgi:hypothetical protein
MVREGDAAQLADRDALLDATAADYAEHVGERRIGGGMGLALGDDLHVQPIGFEHQRHQLARRDRAPGEIAREVPEIFRGVVWSHARLPQSCASAMPPRAPPRAICQPSPHLPASIAL